MARTRLFSVTLALSCGAIRAAEPNPPVWSPSVKVYGPNDNSEAMKSDIAAAFTENGGHVPDDHGQFSSKRYAFLFKPGTYDVEVPVGYYTHVAGLGEDPRDVRFTSDRGVYCTEGSFTISPGALNTFWRMAENFQSDATHDYNGVSGMLWAASQAAPLRRVVVTKDLSLYQYTGQGAAGYASGGFMANMQVYGTVSSGSQQQFLTRNSDVGVWNNGVWNMVFVGTNGAPAGHCGGEPYVPAEQPYVTVAKTPVVAEKPFISIDKADKFYLNVPKVKYNTAGHDYQKDTFTQHSFSDVYVARAEHDTAETINAKLKQGLHVVLSPGIYSLSSPLLLNKANQVLLGLGLATLMPANGNVLIKVGNVDGVRVAGLLLEAGNKPAEALLEWGHNPGMTHSTFKGNAKNPGFLHDIFTRVGGPAEVPHAQAKVMVKINSGHVVGDNLWLWRADHTSTGTSPSGSFPVENAAVINGDDVTMYGLAAEHALQDQVQWNGDRGATYFFQCELPYDVDQSFGDKGYVGYRVNAKVKEHASHGAGVYHYFRDSAVVVKSGISCPSHLEQSFVSPLAVFLNGKGIMRHILNDKGEATQKPDGPGASVKWFCGGAPQPPSPTPTPPPSPTPTPPSPSPWPPSPSPNPPAPTPSPTPPVPPGTSTCKGLASCAFKGMTCQAISYGKNNGCGFTCPDMEFLNDQCQNPNEPPSPPSPPTPPSPSPPAIKCNGYSECTYQSMTCKAIAFGPGCGFQCPNMDFLNSMCQKPSKGLVV